MTITDEDLNRMWEDEKRYRARTHADRLIELLERQRQILMAMQITCQRIEKVLKGE